MGASRTEKAMMGTFSNAPLWFNHSVTPGKPTPPDSSTLTAPDMDRFNQWLALRESNSGMTGDLTTNMTPDLQSMIASYEAYYATPAYASWKATDSVSREMQWRLSQVDIVEAVNAKATIPPSFAADGIGTAAPGLGDITIAAGLSPNSGDVVATGGKSSEIVFGDDGDIVYTGD